MKIVTSAEMREIDRLSAERYGVATHTLMENAGSAVADYILEHYPHEQSIGVICGKGNNGGDGFVAARKLHKSGKDVQVLLLGDPKELKGDAAENFRKLVEKSKFPPSRKERSGAQVQEKCRRGARPGDTCGTQAGQSGRAETYPKQALTRRPG